LQRLHARQQRSRYAKKFRDNLHQGGGALSKYFPRAGFSSTFTWDSLVGVQRRRMIGPVRKFWRDDAGAIEYELIAAAFSHAILAVVNGMGTGLGAKFTSINSSQK
jgi:Flp pilus assembly pilin Flp